ncbi:MAG: S1 RNA-binding domain-containing protein [Planctomycetaceae bacterium]|nr:S1 RNA-binding domain-containing protein [Planctomycetaceae bacterium]
MSVETVNVEPVAHTAPSEVQDTYAATDHNHAAPASNSPEPMRDSDPSPAPVTSEALVAEAPATEAPVAEAPAAEVASGPVSEAAAIVEAPAATVVAATEEAAAQEASASAPSHSVEELPAAAEASAVEVDASLTLTPEPEPTPAGESASTTDETAPQRRKIQLKPTVSPEDLRAVPTYGSAESAPAGGPETTLPAMAERYLQPPPSGPVELPKDATIEADLEAEISAAMQVTMSAPAATPEANIDHSAGATPLTEDQLEPGAKLKAKVQSVTADNVFCDIGFRSPGVLPAKQFPQGKQPREGEEFLVVVDKHDTEHGVVLVSLPKATRRPRGNWEELAVGQVVECVVNKTNKGGLEVTVSNMRAFLPASQVDVGFVSSLDPYVGQRFAVQITEVNAAKRNLVVSRRALVIQERKELAATFWEHVEVGQQFAGKVKTLKDYGAFVDLGGVDGFLHVGEMSWTRIKHPADLLQEGQAIDVVVLSLDREKHKIGLGMRQLAQNPWNLAVDKYAVGTTTSGRVTRTTDFGAFVELEPGVEGLIHISELDHKRVKRVGEVLNVGQEVQAQVLEVNPERQRISLSLKALKVKPEEPKDEDLSPSKGQAYERKRKEPLRGGTGGNGGGGLFGNPTDFTGR